MGYEVDGKNFIGRGRGVMMVLDEKICSSDSVLRKFGAAPRAIMIGRKSHASEKTLLGM
jgi:hypothetical protein